ncbi:MAG: lecithin retinol acyltransferase family protein [Succinivibrio sp.]|nr:lecithin retinol acyltransferase family protein [Succinivibrio sp.]
MEESPETGSSYYQFERQATAPEEFVRGTHLVARRLMYLHHGIYVGQGQVIENILDDGIVRVSLQDFAEGQRLGVIEHPHRRFSPEQSARRAESQLGESSYNLLFRNCEHFVNWCIEGVAQSAQVRDYAAGAALAAGVTGAVLLQLSSRQSKTEGKEKISKATKLAGQLALTAGLGSLTLAVSSALQGMQNTAADNVTALNRRRQNSGGENSATSSTDEEKERWG